MQVSSPSQTLPGAAHFALRISQPRSQTRQRQQRHHQQHAWRARARRDSDVDGDWKLRDDWRDFPRSKDDGPSSSGSYGQQRGSQGGFDPFASRSQQADYWEQRAAQIQRDAQNTARQAAERFGVKDYRVSPVQTNDLGKFVAPALGIAAFAVLAGPVIGFMLGTLGLIVGATLFSGSMLFAMTFALPLLFGAGALSMLGFWTFGLVSVAASLALPVLTIVGGFSVMKMLAGGGKGVAPSAGTRKLSAEERAAAAAAAEAEAERRQAQEDELRRAAELDEFDRRLNRSDERSRDRMY